MRKRERTQPGTSQTKADAILCADLHLRDDRPVGRNDDYRAVMLKKLAFIRSLAKKHECPAIVAGDIFDRWKVSPRLLTEAERYLPEVVYAIPGQHDLPTHSFSRFPESALFHLWSSNRIEIPLPEYDGETMESKFDLYGFRFGEEIRVQDTWPGFEPMRRRQVALIHQFAYRGRKPWPGCEAEGLRSIMNRLEDFDLIVIGDNHKPFVYRNKDQLVVNCGSMMRMRADQIDYKPQVWLWYAEENAVEPVEIPIEPDVISREHIEALQIRDRRIEAFVAQLDGEFDVGMSFRINLDNFMRANEMRPIVKRTILEAVEGES